LNRQREQSAEEALKELLVYWDVGPKKNSKGYKENWVGDKLHADINVCGLPVSIALTAASIRDSQFAMPLKKIARSRLDPYCTPGQGGHQPPGIGNTPSDNHRKFHRIDHLRNQSHQG
jgi:hypothetical protein